MYDHHVRKYRVEQGRRMFPVGINAAPLFGRTADDFGHVNALFWCR